MSDAFTNLDDLYKFIDANVATVKSMHPFWPCRKGCSILDGKNCCHYSIFPVSKTEWRRVRRAVRRLPQDTIHNIRAGARGMYERYSFHRGINYFATFKKLCAQVEPCPLLVNQECAAYSDRPVICRSFGYFADAPTQTFHWCAHVSKVVQEQGVRRVPSWSILTSGIADTINGPVKPLCVWLVEDMA